MALYVTLRSLNLILSTQHVERWHHTKVNKHTEKRRELYVSIMTYIEQSSDLHFRGAPLLPYKVCETNGRMSTSRIPNTNFMMYSICQKHLCSSSY